MQTVDLLVPVFKPDEKLLMLLERIDRQTIRPQKIILIDSDRKSFEKLFEQQKELLLRKEIIVYHISAEEFDHGGTRKQGMELSDSEFVLCMTQDAVPFDDKLIENLLVPFSDEDLAVCCARQLPDDSSREMEKFTRAFNYPEQSRIKSSKDEEELGIKTYFCSNVCALYRKSIYERLGGFIERTIFNEDMIFAGTAIQNGYKVGYIAEARVYHSHNYTAMQQFRRNFDLGVSQAEHPEIFERFHSESEGMKLLKMTIKHLWKVGKTAQIPRFIIHSGYKLIGYRMGKRFRSLSRKVILFCTMNRNYWKKS